MKCVKIKLALFHLALFAMLTPIVADEPRPNASAEDKAAITALLSDATDRSFSGKGLGPVLELVAKTDRDRVSKTLDRSENEQFIAAADAIARLWREKYNHNFDAAENQQAMQYLAIVRTRDEQGRDRATVSFPAQGGRSRFDIRLIKEGSADWRILLPDSVTPGNFAGRMAKSMQLLADQHEKGKWPENRSDAYLNVTAQTLHTLASETHPTTPQD